MCTDMTAQNETANEPMISMDREQGLVAQSIKRIAALIGTRQLIVGDNLPSEVQLAKQLGVSRSVVREAVGSLAALGTLDVGNGRPPRVARSSPLPISISINHAVQTRQISFSQVWETRECIESRAAALAARSRSIEDAYRLIGIAESMRASRDQVARLVELDIEFHRTIGVASQNILMAHLLESFVPLMHQAIPAAWRTRTTSEEHERTFAAHDRIANAILTQNVDEAAAAMADHFDKAIYRQLVESEIMSADDQSTLVDEALSA